MGLFDNLFKAKPDAADEAVVEAAKRIAEHEKARLLEASRVVPAAPAARSGIVPTAKPAPVVPAPRAYSPRTLGQVVPPTRPSRSGEATTRKIRFSGHEENTRPNEVVLTVEDVLSRIPMELITDEPHDLSRELRFRVEDLSADIARGRAAVSLGSIAAQVPELFREPIAHNDARQIRLPLQKLVEQIGFLPIKPTAPAPSSAPVPVAHEPAPTLPPPPGPGPTMLETPVETFAPSSAFVPPPMPAIPAETDTAPNLRISLSLAAVLKTCPRDLIVADLPPVNESDRISFAWPAIEKQLQSGGLIEVSSVRFIFALPAYLHGYFEAREGIRVPLPLDEIRRNMPGGAGVSVNESDILFAPENVAAPAFPLEPPVPAESISEPPPAVFAETRAPRSEPAVPPSLDDESIPVVVFARRKPATPPEVPPPMPVEPAALFETAPVEVAPPMVPAAPIEPAAVVEPVAPVAKIEEPVIEEPVFVPPVVEEVRAEVPAPEPPPVVEPPAAEAPLIEPPIFTPPVVEEVRAEVPATEPPPVVEPPAAEAPVVEPPIFTPPIVEEARAEIPATEPPVVEEPPATEVPLAELPPAEVAAVEAPVVEIPGVELPILQAEIEPRPLDLPPPLVAHAPPTLSVEPMFVPEMLAASPIPAISEIEAPAEPLVPSEPAAMSEPVVPPIFVPPPLRQTGESVAPESTEMQLAPPNVWMQPPSELAARSTSPWPPDVAPPPSPILPVRIIAPPVARPIVAPPPLFSGATVEIPALVAIPAPEPPPPPPPPPPLNLDIARAALGVEGDAALADLGAVLLRLPGVSACHLIVRHESASAGDLPAGFDPVAVGVLSRQLSTALDSSAESLGAGRVQHMTIFAADACVSFFTQGEATVCAIHRTRAFLPGVRERLTATATALAQA